MNKSKHFSIKNTTKLLCFSKTNRFMNDAKKCQRICESHKDQKFKTERALKSMQNKKAFTVL